MKTNTYNRREFLKVAGLGAACAAFSIPRDASAGDRRRLPNILFWSAGGRSAGGQPGGVSRGSHLHISLSA